MNRNGEGVEFKRLPYGMPTLPSYKLNGEWRGSLTMSRVAAIPKLPLLTIRG